MDVNAKEIKYYKLDKPQAVISVNWSSYDWL
jgi:hypothetical protein